MRNSYKVLMNLMPKSNTTRIEVKLPVPLTLDTTKNNYLCLMAYRYSNVFCNVLSDIVISPGSSWLINGSSISEAKLKAPALLSLEYIYDWFKTNTNDLITAKINNYGRCELTFDVSVVSVSITNLGCLSSMFFGYFNQSITTVSTKESPKMPSVSDFNSIILTSSLVGGNTLMSDNDGNFISSQGIVINESDGSLGDTISWKSNFQILYPILGNEISSVIFELRDDNNKPLVILNESITDFNVWAMIIQD